EAKKTFIVATNAIKDLMNDARAGKELKPENAQETAENIISAIDRNPQAMNAATRIKTRDEYTFQHSVGVTTLLTGFAKKSNFSLAELEEIAIGGIMHDIGKINVPDSILNKPDKLNDEEFVIMKKHVTYSREILEEHNNFTQIETDIALLHHERPDGKGYPLGLKGDEISKIGYMGAIVDVYDALSTKRVYKEAWEPSVALKNMVKWGPGQFHQEHLQWFIKYLGVYPVGTWVKLESDLVGFILSQTENLLEPIVQIKLNTRTKRLMNETYDLRQRHDDRIKEVVSPTSFGLDDDFII
ncbi:MAG: HD-GYP domain-containing protein, partial [Gammaproteobacteria bacterium]|nr:HD-GYP domain-containing protein [Gammaproteobacteria bacterium]